MATNILSSSRNYADRLVDASIDGMKALLLDGFTTKLMSLNYSQTEIMEKDVVLVERLGKTHESMMHLKCIVYIQPTESNIKQLMEEIKEPSFREYHVYFTNTIEHRLLAMLGKVDEMEIVKQVFEFYTDFIPVNEDFFHLDLVRLNLVLPSLYHLEP